MTKERTGEDWVEVQLKPGAGSYRFDAGAGSRLFLEPGKTQRIPRSFFDWLLRCYPEAPIEEAKAVSPAPAMTKRKE